jgi:hypothetical protein
MANSVTTKKQTRTFGPVPVSGWGHGATITAEVRWDDECGNGHNSFAITGEIRRPNRNDVEACGMLHDEIRKYFPELAPLLKWHLCSANEPLHYIANTLYWLGFSGYCNGKPNDPPNIEHARSAAVWPEMPESFLSGTANRADVVAALEARRQELKDGLKAAVESLGMVY